MRPFEKRAVLRWVAQGDRLQAQEICCGKDRNEAAVHVSDAPRLRSLTAAL